MKFPEVKQKIESGNPPALDDLIKYGHPGFIAPLSQKEPKIQYNTLIEAIGLNPNVDHNKYRFLNYNEKGNSHSYEQKMEIAKEFLNINIIPKLLEKDLIKPGETPGVRELVKGGFSGFFPSLAFKGEKINYNELIKAVGLNPNITHGRWNFIKYDNSGNVLSKEEKVRIAVNYFNKAVYPDLVKKGVVRQGEPPTSLDLQDYKHEDFLSALRGKEPKVSFNRLIESAGYRPRYHKDHEKWEIFYNDDGKPLSRKGQINAAVKFFKTEIIPKLISNKVIVKGQTPDIQTLNKHNFANFYGAIIRRSISYQKVVKEAGLEPNYTSILAAIGQNLHWGVEKIFLKHTRSKNCESFYEVKGNGDNTLIIDDNFRNLSNGADLFSQIRPDIKIINFDYYLANSEKEAVEHSQREYQSMDTALFLIPINAKEPQSLNKEVPYSANVFILNPKGFAEFLGYSSKNYEEFIENVELAINAPYTKESQQILIEKAIESYDIIKSELNYSTKEFNNFLDTQKEPSG